MRRTEKEKNWFRKILSSKLILGGTIILLIFISVALGKAVYKRYQIQKEIALIQAEIQKAEGKNKELARLLEYLDTSSFQEKMARQKLNLKREGENVVVIPVKKKGEEVILGENNQNNNNEPLAETKTNKFENPKKWWYYFFSTQ